MKCGIIYCVTFILALHFVRAFDGIPIRTHAGDSLLTVDKADDVDPRDASLLKASSEGDVDTVKRVLATGAKLECRDYKVGNTPLIWAAFNGHVHVMKVLVDKGAHIEAISSDGHKTPLLIASYRGNQEAVMFLLRQGARIDHYNNRGDTSISLASYMNHIQVIDSLLFRRADITITTKDMKYTPLHIAAYKGHLVIVKKLIEDGVAASTIINAKDRDGNTPFLLAASHGKDDTVSFFLEYESVYKVDIYASDILGNTAVMLSVNNGHMSTTSLLLDGTDIDINQKNKRGETPLIRAAAKNHVGLVRYLLTKGANIDLLNSRGEDAMEAAIEANNEKCVTLLEEYYRLNKKKRNPILKMTDKDALLHGTSKDDEFISIEL
jgi:ankyrin repeat protein